MQLRLLGAESAGPTHERQSAVSALVDLGLIDIDENPRMAEGAAAAVARHNAVLGPTHRLLVNELDSGVRTGLSGSS